MTTMTKAGSSPSDDNKRKRRLAAEGISSRLHKDFPRWSGPAEPGTPLVRDRTTSGRSSVASSLGHHEATTATTISVQRINAEDFRVRQFGGKGRYSVAYAPNTSAAPPQRGRGADITATSQRKTQNLNDRRAGPSLEIALQRSSAPYILAQPAPAPAPAQPLEPPPKPTSHNRSHIPSYLDFPGYSS